MTVNKNFIGGAVAVAVLAAIFYYGGRPQPAPAPAAKPTVTVVQPAPKPEPAPKPAPKPEPAPKPPVVAPKPPLKAPPKVTVPPGYHRIETGGKLGEPIECSSTTPVAEGKSPADLLAIAKQYGVTVDAVKTWLVCNP